MEELMQEARIVRADQFEVVAAPRPRLRGPAELLVRTAACGICSGDLMPWYLEKKVGGVLGHEVVGWAVEVGSAIPQVRPGDLVFLHHHAPCRQCPCCARGDFVHCPTWRGSQLDPGGMAEFIRVPEVNARHDCFAVNDLEVEEAVFIEPLGCSVKALKRASRAVALAGSSGAIVGCGVMGLLNLEAARALGAGRLVAVEPDPDRRHAAARHGADLVLTPAQAASRLRQQVDFVVIGPGQPEVIRQALAYVRPGGAAVLFTPTPTAVSTPLDLGDLYFREISLVPSYSCGPDDTRDACELLRQGKVRLDDLVTHRFSLADIQKAYETARRGGPALKVLVTFDA
jgi:L-iditol 2-dehydrogenase